LMVKAYERKAAMRVQCDIMESLRVWGNDVTKII
jgi:hypothetical protein